MRASLCFIAAISVAGCTSLLPGTDRFDGGPDVLANDVLADSPLDTPVEAALDVMVDVPAMPDASDTGTVDASDTGPSDTGAVDASDTGPSDTGPDTGCTAGNHVCAGACVADNAIEHCGTQCTPCPGASGIAGGRATCDGTMCGVQCDPGRYYNGTACLLIPPPRLIAPLSGSFVTSRRPLVQWSNAMGATGAHVQFCADRACSTVLAMVDAMGTSAAPTADLSSGTVFVRAFGIAGGGMSATPSATWEIVVPARSAPAQGVVGVLADFDGDGRRDVVVGAPSSTVTPGAVHLYRGPISAPVAMPQTLLSPFGAPQFGTLVAAAGDLNGDGFVDLAVTEPSSNRVWIYAGGTTRGVVTNPDMAMLPDAVPATALAAAGDVNGDGYGDLAVGATSAVSGAGRVYLVFGGPNGVLTPGAPLTIDSPAGAASAFGFTLSGGGDVNGDGLGDFVVGAPSAVSDHGAAYVYFGHTGGGPAAMLGATLTTAGGVTRFGSSVALLGDVNGDGLADVGVTSGGSGVAGHVYLGHSGGVAGEQAVTGAPFGARGSAPIVAAAGDTDGDGYDDVAFGITLVSSSSSGYVQIFRGGATGVQPTASATLQPMLPPGTSFTAAIAGHGDLTGDGLSDVVVSSGTRTAYLFAGPFSGTVTSATQWNDPTSTDRQFGASLAFREAPTRNAPAALGYGIRSLSLFARD